MEQPDIHVHVHVHVDQGVDYGPRFDSLEAKLMALIEDLTALRADFDGYKADVAAKLNAVAVQIAQLQEQILNGDPEARVLVATIKADIDEARVVVGDANEDGDPATSAPEPEPTP